MVTPRCRLLYYLGIDIILSNNVGSANYLFKKNMIFFNNF